MMTTKSQKIFTHKYGIRIESYMDNMIWFVNNFNKNGMTQT